MAMLLKTLRDLFQKVFQNYQNYIACFTSTSEYFVMDPRHNKNVLLIFFFLILLTKGLKSLSKKPYQRSLSRHIILQEN